MESNKNRMIVISFDGLSTSDIEKLKNIEGCKEFFEKASYCDHVKSVYPSLTYPAHTSISTGMYPNRHGITNNLRFQPKRRNPDWFWYIDHVKADTFYEMAEIYGIKTAALFWPVSAGANISYNMPEVLANRPWETQLTTSLKAGSKSYQIDMVTKFGKYLNGINQPELDHFTHNSLLYTLRNKDVELVLVHYTDLDTIRHYNGFDSEEASASLTRHANRLKDIIAFLKEENSYEDTTLIVLGDHSSKDVIGKIHLNTLFHRMGYIQLDKRGIQDYEVVSDTCEGSAYVYVKRTEALPHVYGELKKLKEQGVIEAIYTSEEAGKMGADPHCTFMVEAAEGYYFSNRIEEQVVCDLGIDENGVIKVNGHGYHPDKENYDTVFLASGRGIKENVRIEKMSLVDIGPTLAHILGFDLKNVDGRILNEILNP